MNYSPKRVISLFSLCFSFVTVSAAPAAADDCQALTDTLTFCEVDDWFANTLDGLEGPLVDEIVAAVGNNIDPALTAVALNVTFAVRDHLVGGYIYGVGRLENTLTVQDLASTLPRDDFEDEAVRTFDVEVEITEVDAGPASVRYSYFYQLVFPENPRHDVQPIHVVEYLSPVRSSDGTTYVVVSRFFDQEMLATPKRHDPSIELQTIKLPAEKTLEIHRALMARLDVK